MSYTFTYLEYFMNYPQDSLCILLLTSPGIEIQGFKSLISVGKRKLFHSFTARFKQKFRRRYILECYVLTTLFNYDHSQIVLPAAKEQIESINKVLILGVSWLREGIHKYILVIPVCLSVCLSMCPIITNLPRLGNQVDPLVCCELTLKIQS